MRAITFGELIDEVLTRLGFTGETGTIRDVAKSMVRAAHEERVVARDYSFMRMPAPSTFTTVAGQRSYSLSPYFRSPIWFRDRTTGSPHIESQSSMQMDNNRPLATSTADGQYSLRFELRGHSNVWRQPTEPGVITASSSEVAEDAGNTVTVEGVSEDGLFVTEELTLPTAGTVEFAVVTNIRKNGTEADWAGNLTVSADAGATVLAFLVPSSFGNYFRQLYFLDNPTSGRVVEYDFWRLPNPLEEDNDIPSIPAPFARILVYDALIAMSGYSRATGAEMGIWQTKQEELQHSLDAAYDEGQSNHGDAAYIHKIPR